MTTDPTLTTEAERSERDKILYQEGWNAGLRRAAFLAQQRRPTMSVTTPNIPKILCRSVVGGLIAIAFAACLILIMISGVWLIQTYEWGAPLLIVSLVFVIGALLANN